MKKLLVVLLTLSMVLGIAPAFGMADAAEPIVITAFVAGDPSIDYSQNYTLKYIEEKTGVRLDVSDFLVTYADAATQKQLVLAGGDYPDIFLTGFSYAEMYNYGQKDGIFMPLNEYLTTRLSEFPTLELLFTERPEYYKMYIAPDGNVYGMPSFSECGHCRALNKTYINTEWLSKVGKEMPTTLEELRDVLAAFKETDLNENGAQDEIALTSNDGAFISYIVNAFLPCEYGSGKFTSIADGKVSFAANTDTYREALAYIKAMVDDGLIDEAAFTQSSSQMSQVVSGEVPMVGVFSTAGGIYEVDMTNQYVYSNYKLMMPVEGPSGVVGADNRPISDMNVSSEFALTDACENPDAAMKFMDTLMNFDTYMMRVYGLENEGWITPEAGQTNVLGGEYKYQFIDTVVGGEAKTENTTFYGGPWGALMQFRALWSNRWPDEVLYSDSKFFESRIELETVELSEKFIESAPRFFFLGADETTEYSELYTNISEYVKLSTAQFVTGVKDLEADWESYKNELQRYGVDRFVELYQMGYDSIQG